MRDAGDDGEERGNDGEAESIIECYAFMGIDLSSVKEL